MSLLKEKKDKLLVKALRRRIFDIEEAIKNNKNPKYQSFFNDTKNCPLNHYFSDGIYVREITIPAGMVIVGKIHKHRHPNFLIKGKVMVITEQKGEEILEGPCFMMSEGGTKRALYAVTDLVWTTIHHNPTNTQDLDKIEDIVIAKNYEEYEKFLSSEKSVVKKIKNKIIKMLSL
tara:strand:+ start:10242 stop:10766 length:525 start_codon:yes stop_codon:yes gene_type:complete